MPARGLWYQGGLHFRCQGCGNCCAGPQEGYVWVTGADMKAMAVILGLSLKEFKSRYVRGVGAKTSLVEDPDTKDCVFLQRQSDGRRGCVVYEARPVQCRTWPFWKENLAERDDWLGAADSCPGIGSGQWYAPDAIEKVRRGLVPLTQVGADPQVAAIDWIAAHRGETDYADALGELYGLLDQHLDDQEGRCQNCRRCCNFAAYGHRLYATTLEMALFSSLWAVRPDAGAVLKAFDPIAARSCPFLGDGGCTVRDVRPSGCRIFYCSGLSDEAQSQLTEKMLDAVKQLHHEFSAPYLYADVMAWLGWLKP